VPAESGAMTRRSGGSSGMHAAEGPDESE
jgi:hypothetical protein